MARFFETMTTENYCSFEDQQQQHTENRNRKASLRFDDGFDLWSNSSNAVQHAFIHIIIYLFPRMLAQLGLGPFLDRILPRDMGR